MNPDLKCIGSTYTGARDQLPGIHGLCQGGHRLIPASDEAVCLPLPYLKLRPTQVFPERCPVRLPQREDDTL